MNITNLTISQILEHYRNKDFTPTELIQSLLQRAHDLKEYNSWIYLMSFDEIQPYLETLNGKSPDELPLYGVPFAIKDNIDLKGIPTTAACEAFSYTPAESAYVVQLLINAGAIPLGKTNLDQFATGLVGVRSPFGATKNSFNQEYIAGGSSSGSAVVVAQGLVSFALGTDTAGSGRVPAAFNNILGLKSTRGLLSNRGVVPACKSLDCLAFFTTTTHELCTLFELTAKHDPLDPYSRHEVKTGKHINYRQPPFTFAVPKTEQLEFFGNEDYLLLFSETILELEKLGGIKKEIDFSAFINAAKLLYQGPWVTERYLACESIIEQQPEVLLDVTRTIIGAGKDNTAADAFRAQYKLQACKQITDKILDDCDFLVTPTAGTIYTLDEVENNPIELNSNLGYYTNYMNLLDYTSIAVPSGFTKQGLPFGVTLVSTAFSDRKLLNYAGRLQHALNLPLGATNNKYPEKEVACAAANNLMSIVVCGAHMSELPLNAQLLERDATLVKKCTSAPHYQLVALPGGPPERPGMIRTNKGGVAIEVEVWEMPAEHFGSFLAGIPHPLGLGKVELDNGDWEPGFICEAYIEAESTNISSYGGWRSYIHNKFK
ncbi:MAG: allophanate hydrolase [Thioalkalispiraceae bacterium]|jgi:allophanate hydrolase